MIANQNNRLFLQLNKKPLKNNLSLNPHHQQKKPSKNKFKQNQSYLGKNRHKMKQMQVYLADRLVAKNYRDLETNKTL